MLKITFIGAGSTIFAKNLLGDCFLTADLAGMHVALYDIDAARLDESAVLVRRLNEALNMGRATITTHLGLAERKAALAGANHVINAIQVGGYEPCTVSDFEIPKKFSLRQTIGDTIGIGGIFRALRTIPVLDAVAREMEQECPNALLLNYSNPMAILTGWVLSQTRIRTVGLCHSVQKCVGELFSALEIRRDASKVCSRIAGINHMAWLLELKGLDGEDLYPEVIARAREKLAVWRKAPSGEKSTDMVRLQMMLWFGHYITESSEHNAEYTPYWIKRAYPDLIREFNIPLDEYPRRCVRQIEDWRSQAAGLLTGEIRHERSDEFASRIIEAGLTGGPYVFAGNVLNRDGLIGNLPTESCVEVPVMVDSSGLHPCPMGDLPEPCAALNRTNINPQLLTLRAAHTRRREHVYQAAMLDPHTSSELSPDDIISLCDALFAAHGDWLPEYS